MINVYVGDYGTYVIPRGLIEYATENSTRPITDKRTRGGKAIEMWGKRQDSIIRASQTPNQRQVLESDQQSINQFKELL